MSESKPSLRDVGGVARIIHDTKKAIEAKMRDYLLKRCAGGYCDLSAAEIETQARYAGEMSGPIMAKSLGAAFQLGTDLRETRDDDDKW